MAENFITEEVLIGVDDFCSTTVTRFSLLSEAIPIKYSFIEKNKLAVFLKELRENLFPLGSVTAVQLERRFSHKVIP